MVAVSLDSRASSLFSALAYEEDAGFFVLEDGKDVAVGVGWLCDPLPGGDDHTMDRLKVILNEEFPTGTLLQFFLWASPNVVRQFTEVRNLVGACVGDVVRDAAEARLNFLSSGVDAPIDSAASSHIRDFKLLVCIKFPVKSAEISARELDALLVVASSVEEGLKTASLVPERLTATGYLTIMSEIMNRNRHASWRLDGQVPAAKDIPLREQILDYDTDFRVERDCLRLGEGYVSTLSVKRFPQAVNFGSAAYYIGDLLSGARGIRDPFFISATIFYPDQVSERAKHGNSRAYVANAASGPLFKFLPALAQKKRDFDVLFESLDGGSRICRLYLNVSVFTKNRDDCAAARKAVQSFWSEQGFQLYPDQYYNKAFFLNSLPFNCEGRAIKDLFRFKTFSTDQVTALIPVLADSKGSGTPSLLFVSRNGQLMRWCLFDSNSNFNAVIAAQSGSGKSFLTNEIIMSYLAQGAQVWVIDVGRSYQKLCESVGGDFMVFDHDSRICLNLFALISNIHEEMDMVVGLLAAMAAPTQPLTDYQDAELQRILLVLWDQYGRNLTIDLVVEALKQHDQERVRDIGVQLERFSTLGANGKYFSGTNTVDFKNRFTVLELEELKGRKHLQRVVLLHAIYQIQQAMFLGDRDRRKIVIIDEAWDLLSEGDVAKFMESAYRRVRKYNGSAIAITQSPLDLEQSQTGRAVRENSNWHIYLGQKSATIETMHREGTLSLGDWGVSLLKTVHTVAGHYSEAFFNGAIHRLIVSPFSKLLYSTKASDVTAVARHFRSGLTMKQAIEAVLAERRNGSDPQTISRDIDKEAA